MIFTILYKHIQEVYVFGSIVAISEHTYLKKNKLYYHFGKKNKTVYEDSLYRIEKTEIIRSKQK